MPTPLPPVACNLAAVTDRERHQVLSRLLQTGMTGRAELPEGFVYSINLDLCGLAAVGEWIALERQCCPFLQFELSISGSDVTGWLTLTGPERAQEILDREFPI